jgi:hypothetical protein
MRWPSERLEQITERLVQIGLEACPVCESTTLRLDPRPAVLRVGGSARRHPSGTPTDPDELEERQLVRVSCVDCGCQLFFDMEIAVPSTSQRSPRSRAAASRRRD